MQIEANTVAKNAMIGKSTAAFLRPESIRLVEGCGRCGRKLARERPAERRQVGQDGAPRYGAGLVRAR